MERSELRREVLYSSLDECEDIDEPRELLRDLDRECDRLSAEPLLLRELLPPPGLRILGASQSAPMALSAL
jgi:hypothetical protein